MSDFDIALNIDQIRDGDRLDLVASAGQCNSIARRLGIARIDRLEAHAVLDREGERITARGRLGAALEQQCAVTGEPIAAAVDEPFALQFVPEPKGLAVEELELGAEDCDTIFHDGATIDLGSAIADTLALSVDPYPRSASADAVLKRAGVLSEEEAGPFAGLAALRDKLGGSDG